MKALLLSAGLGTRLRPITNYVPKCLVPIDGKPLIEYWLDNLYKIGISEFIINTHYLKKQVEDYVNDSKYKNIIKLVYEEELLFTGGTILNCKNDLKDEAFMVIHSDNLSFCDFKAFINAHQNRPNRCEMTMMTFSAENPSACGVVALDKDGVVEKFFEKVKNPPTNLANAAVYIMEPSIFELLETFNKKEIDLSIEVMPKLLNKIYTFHNDIYHRDIGTLESYAIAQIYKFF